MTTDATVSSPDTTVRDSSAKRLDRRQLLAGAGLAGAGVLAAPSIARAQAREIKLATSWPKNTPGVGVNAQRFADMVTAMSGGRLNVRLYGAGEIVPPFEVFDAVGEGTVEMGHATPYYWTRKNQAFNFFTGVPFGLSAHEHAAWIYFGGGQALWEKAYAPFNVVPFYAGSSGPQAGGWFTKEINTLDDLAGVKMRISGLGGEVLRRLGVSPVMMPPGEIPAALSSGLVDAVEWIGPWNDLAFGLFKNASYYYVPAFHEPGPALEVLVNADFLAGLDDDLRTIITVAAKATSMEAYTDFTYHNIDALPQLLDGKGVELRTWSDDIVRAMGRESAVVLAEVGEADAETKEVYDAFIAFRDKAATYAAEAGDLVSLQLRQTGLAAS